MRLTLPTMALLMLSGAAMAQGTGGTTAAPSAPGTQIPGGAQTPGATVNTPSNNTSTSPSAVQTQNTASRTRAAPVPGRNSFTMAQARRRITSAGFTAVTGLKKDGQGVWRGQAQKDGSPVAVSLDYQGNVVGQ